MLAAPAGAQLHYSHRRVPVRFDSDEEPQEHVRLYDLIPQELRDKADTLFCVRTHANRSCVDDIRLKRAAAALHVPPRAQNATPPARSPAPNQACARGCGIGTCNEVVKSCDCVLGYVGEACETLALPACLMPGGHVAHFQTPRKTCACLLQWIKLLESSAIIPSGEHTCLDAGPAMSMAQVLQSPSTFQQRVWLGQPGGVLHDADPFRMLDNTSASACPDSCGWRGSCVTAGHRGLLRDAAAGDQPKCVCPEFRVGHGAQGVMWGHHNPACTSGRSFCLNDCRGKGDCVSGMCVCRPGFWGLDCSTTTGPDGKSIVLGPMGTQRTAAPLRPSVFVYDLPAPLGAWAPAMEGMSSDFGRLDGPLLLAAFLRSAHRTADPAAADLFLVPVIGGTNVARLPALRYVRERWPYFNASVAAGVVTHFLPTVCHDQGILSYSGFASELLAGLRRAPLKPGEPWAAALPPILAHTAVLSCNGLHLGGLRGFYPRNNTFWWTPESGAPDEALLAEALRHSGAAGGFTVGKDVVMPNSHHQLLHSHAEGGCVPPAPLGLQGGSTLYFEGTVEKLAEGEFSPFNSRKVVIDLLRGRTGFSLRNSHEHPKEQGPAWDMLQARFCFSPGGNAGGFGDRELEACCPQACPLPFEAWLTVTAAPCRRCRPTAFRFI